MRNYTKPFLLLILISTITRGFLAGFLELGNDEVYYWTYAMFPDLSHFDHPPMVGWVIQLFTLNLLVDHEFFLRLAAIVLGSINTWLIYLIGRSIYNARAGWYAAILYTSSVYSFLIAGVFIMPDTPQLFYWLISIYFILEAFDSKKTLGFRKNQLTLAGVSIGLAMLSKYTSVFLWVGILAYIVFYERYWLKSIRLYLAIALSFVFILPVLWWNVSNDFISFTYHSGRVGFFDSGININTFIAEFIGQIFYNNPVNFVLLILAFVAFSKWKRVLTPSVRRIILLTTLPLILLFLFFSLFRQTLPHWTGPAYTSLILLTASWLSFQKSKTTTKRILPLSLVGALSLTALLIFLGSAQIKGGWLFYDDSNDPRELGRNDVSLDMYGWRQAGVLFHNFLENQTLSSTTAADDLIISYRWFPAAHIDYYMATPLGIRVLGMASLERIHKYAWINDLRGGLEYGQDAWYITTSRDYKDVFELYGDSFLKIVPADTLRITRNGKPVENVFIYRMFDLQELPEPEF
jgi:hypothetical protein